MGRLEREASEKNVAAPPSYEEAASQSPLQNERYEFCNAGITYALRIKDSYHYYLGCRDGEISGASAPRGSSPVSDNPHQTYGPTDLLL